jgi:hypothetical protein
VSQSQQTLKQPVSFAGIGLHSGNRVNMTLVPAPAGTGLRFRRVDLEGKPELEASADLVGDTQRSTSLSKGPVKLHTVEHVLAALAGAGVTNAVVELDANEPPISDGSSREFARLVREAGILQTHPGTGIEFTAAAGVTVGLDDEIELAAAVVVAQPRIEAAQPAVVLHPQCRVLGFDLPAVGRAQYDPRALEADLLDGEEKIEEQNSVVAIFFETRLP